MAANLIRVDTTGCNLDYIVYLSTTSGGYLTVKDSGINSSFFTSNANAIVISTTSGQTLFDGNTREYIRSPKGSLSFTLTHSRWRLLNTVPYTPLGDAVLSNVVTTDLSMFGSVSNYVDFIVPNTMNVFGGFESQPLPTVHGIPVITASDITSTVAGLGSLGYLSSPGTLESNLVSTVVGLGGYGYISMSQLTSTASGLGSIGYISQATLHSTLGGLGTYGYISTSSLVSSIRGLSMIYISSSSLPSTVNGLGTEGYISMPQFTSSIIGISSIYASNIYSTITYLGGSNENQPGFYTVTTTGSNGPFASPKSIARDSLGNIYVADASNHRIRKIDPSGVVTTVAGSTAGFADGINGLLNSPQGISLSGSNIYVADTGNNRIRLIMPGASTTTLLPATVTTLAGSTIGCNNGPAASAQFNEPYGVAIDSAGVIYVADFANHRIRKIDRNSNVTTLAGSMQGFANGQATGAQFNSPTGVAVDSAGIIYVADSENHQIRKIDINSNVTTLAGSGMNSFANGQGTAASFFLPTGIAVDSAGSLYVTDYANNLIRKIDTSSNVTTLAGSTQGFSNAQGTAAQFNGLNGIAVDSAGSVYVGDRLNYQIRKIDTSSNVTTLAGSTQGFANGQGAAAQFSQPFGLTVDSAGNVYVADRINNRIRKIDTSSNVTTLAGSTSGSANGQGTSAQFNQPSGITVDSAGIVYVADLFNNLIRKITTESITTTTSVITTVAGSNAGFADGANGQFNSPQGISLSGSNIYVADTGNNRIRMVVPGTSSTVSQVMVTTVAGSTQGSANGQGTAALFNEPYGVAVDSAGSVYVADSYNNRIRKIDRNSNVTTLAGSTMGFSNAQGTAAQFLPPSGVAVDSAGIVYVADWQVNKIRKIDRSSNVTTFAGSTQGSANGQGTAASFFFPTGVAVDSAGNVYVADSYNNVIRKIDRSSNVTTLAGSGIVGCNNGQGTAAQFNFPNGVAVDSAGVVYVSDSANYRIRKIDINSNVTTLAGSTVGCNDGQGTAAQFSQPFGLTVDSAGIVYVADWQINRIRKIDINSNVTTLAGSGAQGFQDGTASSAKFNQPRGITVDSAGIIYVADTGNHQIRKIATESITTTTSVITTVAGSTAGFADGANGQFNSPQGISLSGSNIYVADTGNNRIRLIMPGTSSTVSQAMVTTVAGSTQGSANGLGTAAQFYTPNGLAFDSAGIIYLADTYNNRIRKISSSNVMTLAGSTQGFVDSQGISAQFYQPTAVILDSSGNVFVADTGNNRIRKIDTGCNVTTVAGSTAGFSDGVNGLLNSPKGISLSGSNIYVADTGNNRIRMVVPGVSTTTLLPATVTTLAGSTQGSANGQGTAAQFFFPYGVAVDSAGIVYVADTFNNRIRKIDTSSNVTTLAGSTVGSNDGQGTAAQFYTPSGVAVDSAGIIYVADNANHRIRKIDRSSNVTTLAGSTAGSANGLGINAQFNYPYGVAVDSAGIIYVSDRLNHLIRKIDINSNVTTLAGSTQGYANDQGTAAKFDNPHGVAVDSAGIIYVVDQGNHRIRKIDRSSNVTTLAGNAALGFANGQGTAAQFYGPYGITVDSAGSLYVADSFNHQIRKIDINSNVTTLAGSTQGGFSNGQGTSAQFFYPYGVAVDSAGIIYVADAGNNKIRKIIQESITTTTAVITTVAGSTAGFSDGANGQFNSPQGISLSGSNIYVADTGNNRIRLIAPGTTSTVSQVMVTTLAGSGVVGCNNGPAASAQFNFPYGVAVNSAGIIYVADLFNNLIRKIDISSNVTTLAGSTQGFSNGPGSNAQFYFPYGIAVDLAGSVYVADTVNNRIRKIDINSNVTTLAGSTQGAVNGQGSNAQFNQPYGVAVDSAGFVYVADIGNNLIRKIDSSSNVTTLAGSTQGAVNGQGSNAQFNQPFGVAVDSAGFVYVADAGNNRIRKIDINSNVTTLAGSTLGFSNAQGTAALFNFPRGVAVDSAGSVYVADIGNNRIRKIDSSSNVTTLAGSTSGFSNAQGTAARFNSPSGVAVDTSGSVYVADQNNNRIRKITTESITVPTSLVTTVAGSNAGFADGGNGQFNSPQGISLSGSNIYVADTGNNRIRLIMPGTSSTVSQAMVTTFAGSTSGFSNAQGSNALFTRPSGVALDSAGIIYVADVINNRIRKIDINSNVTTLAGSTQGFADGQGTAAQFNNPAGLAVDSAGIIYVADSFNNRIRKIDINSNVTTLAGSTQGFANGQGTSAQFSIITGVAVDSAGSVYVVDSENHRIRKIDKSSNVTTLAGSTNGFANGPGTSAQFNFPFGVAVSAGSVYVADFGNNLIRKIDNNSNVTTVAGSNLGCNDGQGINAQFYNPQGITIDSAGFIYVCDSLNHRIRKIDVNSNVTTLAGSTQGAVNGQGSNARFNQPYGVAVDSAGIIYVADDLNNQIRKITTESITTTTSVITTVAGSTAGFANGTPSNALFSSPGGILSDGSNIYVADTGNNQIRKIANEDVATVTSVITTVAGSTAGFADGANAQFNSPQGISLDGSTIYVADAGNNRIRKIVGGTVTTISGCNAGFSNGPASNALFSSPGGIIVDGSTIYVADTSNNLIRKLAFTEGCNSFAVGYVSSATLSYTVANLTNYTSKEGLQSTTTSLSAMDSSNLLSTVQGLGQYYISTATLTSSISGVQASSASNQAAGYISSLDLNSSIAGLGTLGYISISHYISSFSNLISTGPIGYASTLDGIGSLGFISTATVVSTVEGLGSLGYISSSSPLVSTVQGLGQTYISTASLVSTMSNYISTMSNYPTSSNQRLIDVEPIVSTNTAIGRTSSEPSMVTTLSFTIGFNPLSAALMSNYTISHISLFSGTALTQYGNIVTTLAGNTRGYINSVGKNAAFYYPMGITLDSSGNVYVADTGNNVIRKIDINSNVTTLAGSGAQGFQDGTASSAKFNQPRGITVDSAGNIYVADSRNNLIRKIDINSNVTTLAGGFNEPQRVAVDSEGIVYVVDTFNNLIRKIDINSNVTTVAGSTVGCNDGQGTSAQFNYPYAIAVDSAGIIYVADTGNYRIRKIDRSSNVTTLAGSTYGFSNGQGTAAQFDGLYGIAVDSAGNVYATESYVHRIRKIDINSNVTTLVESSAGYVDGIILLARFRQPLDLIVDSSDIIYVADSGNNMVRKITPTLTTTSTDNFMYLANSNIIYICSLTDYSNKKLFLNTYYYEGITNDSTNIYVTSSNSILAYSILTGSNTTIANTSNIPSFVNGITAASVTFNNLKGIAIDAARKNLYVCDNGNNSIRKVQLNPLSVTTLASITSPLGIAIDSYSTYAYVTDTGGNITKVSLFQTNMTTRIVSNLGLMYSIVLDPTNTYAYVTRYTARQLSIVNLANGQTTTTGSGSNLSLRGIGSNAAYSYPSGLVYNSNNTLYSIDYTRLFLPYDSSYYIVIQETTTQFYLSTSTALGRRATAATIAPTTTLTNQVTGQCVYMSNTSVTTTPFISLTPTTVNLTVNLYANSVTAATFTASSGTSASGLGYFFGDGTNVTTISDIRTKENIQPIEHALSTVRSLQAVEYTKIDDPSRRWLGYIAQDVEDSIPEIVTRSGEEEWRSIQYTNLPGLIIEAIKELKRKYERILALVKPG